MLLCLSLFNKGKRIVPFSVRFLFLQIFGKYDEAISTYEKVIEFSPNSGWAYRKLAEVYLVKNEKEKALTPQDTRTNKLLKELGE